MSRASRWLASFITLPPQLVRFYGELIARDRDALAHPLTAPGTSLDSMSPRSPWLRTLASIPVAPTVHAHSIIAVRGVGPAETGEDGVVKYESARLEETESELVVRSGHSVQANPAAINEVRRILLQHLQEAR